jgi:hypothetical protein
MKARTCLANKEKEKKEKKKNFLKEINNNEGNFIMKEGNLLIVCDRHRFRLGVREISYSKKNVFQIYVNRKRIYCKILFITLHNYHFKNSM